MSTIASRLRGARELSDASAVELGTLAGLSRSVVGMIESGERKDPSGTTVLALAKVLGVSVDWLLSGDGPTPTRKRVQTAVALARTEAARKATGTDGDR